MTSNKILLVIVFALIVLRFFFLDQDVAPRLLVGQTPEDESTYAQNAMYAYLNLSNTNSPLTYNGISFYSQPITYCCLKLFGFNFIGLRVGVVIYSLLFMFIFYLTLKNFNINKVQINVIIIFLLADFFLFNMSRIQNPQIYSVTCFAAIFLTIQYIHKNPKLMVLLGVIAASSFTFFYIYNLYIFCATCIWVLYFAISKKSIKSFLLYIVGVIGCLLLFYFCLVYFDAFNHYIKFIFYHNNSGANAQWQLLNIPKAFIQIITTNFFRYNLFLLPLTCYASYIIVKDKILFIRYRYYFVYLAISFVCLLIQNNFIISFPFKKMLPFYPYIIIFIVLAFYTKVEIKVLEWTLIIATSIVFIAVNIYLNNSDNYWNNIAGIQNLKWCFTLVILILSAFTMYKMVNGKDVIFKTFLISAFINLVIVFYYNFYQRTYKLRDAFISIGKQYKNYTIIEQYSPYQILYSTNKPGLDYYTNETVYKTSEYQRMFNELYNKEDSILMLKVNLKNANGYESIPYNNEYLQYNCNFKAKQSYNFEFYSIQVFEKLNP